MTCGAVYWDVAQRVVAEAARLPGGVAWKGNWEPLSRWLLGSGEYPPRTLEDIVAAIARRAARDDYEVPHSSLALFDQVVWAYGTRGRR